MVHVIPVGDVEDHFLDLFCPCGVLISETGCYVHQAYDCRELFGKLEDEVN